MKDMKQSTRKNDTAASPALPRPAPATPVPAASKNRAEASQNPPGGLLHSIFSRPRLEPSKAAIPGSRSALSQPDTGLSKQAQAQPKKPKEPAAPNPTLIRLYRRFGAAMPRGLVEYFDKKMRYAGVEPEQRALLLGRTLLITFLAGLVPLLFYLVIFNPITTNTTIAIAAGLFLGGILLSLILHYLTLYFRIADRSAAVEKLLPDFLSLAVSNLRAGMSPYSAFVQAARPEFGPFHDAVILAMARLGSKGSIADALTDVSENFDSSILRRTVALFSKGVRSGGQLVRLLNSSADEVRCIQDLRTELVASTRTYSIFLSFIVVGIMPFLLAISTNFVTVFVSLQLTTGPVTSSIAGGAQIPSFSGKILITPDDMQNISLITLVVINLLICILIGLIDHGKAIYGVKRFPLLVILSLIAFLVAKAFIASFLSGFML